MPRQVARLVEGDKMQLVVEPSMEAMLARDFSGSRVGPIRELPELLDRLSPHTKADMFEFIEDLAADL